MPASLDDVVSVLQDIRDTIDSALANNMFGGGGGGSARQASQAARQASERSEGAGGLGSALRGLRGATAALGTAAAISQKTGLSAAMISSRLGGSGAEAAGAMGRRALQTVTEDIPFGDVAFANTAQVLQAQGRAQSGVANIAEQVARAGGQLSDGGIDEALRRQNEIETNVQRARIRVGQRQSVVGSGQLAAAGFQDLVDNADSGTFGGSTQLIAAMTDLTEVLRSLGLQVGGIR